MHVGGDKQCMSLLVSKAGEVYHKVLRKVWARSFCGMVAMFVVVVMTAWYSVETIQQRHRNKRLFVLVRFRIFPHFSPPP